MHPVVEAKVTELLSKFRPEHTYRDRLGILSVLEAENFDDVATHATGVQTAAMNIAESIGMSEADRHALGFAIRWHDIGKLAIPTEVLRKAGPLEGDEWRIMQDHTEAGLALVGPDAPEIVKNVIKYHHECYNGRGYNGLKGEEIPLEARICQVADVYDAMRQKRDYKSSLSEETVLFDMMADLHNSRYGRRGHDPFLVRRFITLRLQDQNLLLKDEARQELTSFASSDPMNDLGKVKANGPKDFDYLWSNDGWQVDKSGHRMKFYLDEETGNKKMAELRAPDGTMLRQFIKSAPSLDPGADIRTPAPV